MSSSPTSIAQLHRKCCKLVTTADGCIHSADTAQLDFAVGGKFVQTPRNCRKLVANSVHTADATRQLSHVGVGSEYWASIHWNIGLTCSIFSARQHAERAICYRPSVCPSVTRVDQSKTVEATIMRFSPYSSPIPLVFAG